MDAKDKEATLKKVAPFMELMLLKQQDILNLKNLVVEILSDPDMLVEDIFDKFTHIDNVGGNDARSKQAKLINDIYTVLWHLSGESTRDVSFIRFMTKQRLRQTKKEKKA